MNDNSSVYNHYFSVLNLWTVAPFSAPLTCSGESLFARMQFRLTNSPRLFRASFDFNVLYMGTDYRANSLP